MAVIQFRSGAYADYDPAKMQAAEPAVVLSGDPDTEDGKSVRVAFGSGADKRLLTEDDAFQVDDELSSLSENPVQNKVINTALGSKAPLASPAFTGTPTAPNAAAGTSNQQIANTKFVNDAISGLPQAVQNIWTGKCITNRSTQVKIVILDDPESFSLTDGVIIGIVFVSGNDVASPKLNVNGTGEKTVGFGVAGTLYTPSALPYYRWGQSIVFFRYSGNRWMIASADMCHIKYLEDNKANLASPQFTGTPTVPTAATGTNTTQIASTAFVQTEISASAKSLTATDQGSGVVSLSLT